jgi:hypothetical protein
MARWSSVLSGAPVCATAVACAWVLFAASTFAQTPTFRLFGGPKRDVYLGCLNCDAFAADSVCNEFGKYGNESSPDSIWNASSPFGSDFSPVSPWNQFATRAPAIVDATGGFYGYLSRNESHPRRTDVKVFVSLLSLVGEMDLSRAQKAFCRQARPVADHTLPSSRNAVSTHV